MQNSSQIMKFAALAAAVAIMPGCSSHKGSSPATSDPVDYVSTLVGTQSKHSLSTGNTYPATALPWGMNFW